MMLMSLLVKASVLLAAVGIADALLARRASAAARHLLWTFAVGGLLLLPALSVGLPRWTAVQLTASPAASVAMVADLAPAAARPSAVAPVPTAAAADTGAAMSVPWAAVWPALYGAAVLLLLARLITERLSIRRIERGAAETVDPAWTGLLQECAVRAGVDRQVRLIMSTAPVMPMSFGIRRGHPAARRRRHVVRRSPPRRAAPRAGARGQAGLSDAAAGGGGVRALLGASRRLVGGPAAARRTRAGL